MEYGEWEGVGGVWGGFWKGVEQAGGRRDVHWLEKAVILGGFVLWGAGVLFLCLFSLSHSLLGQIISSIRHC